MLQMSSSSSIVCGISTKFMVPLSLPPSFNIRQRKKILVLDYCGFNKVLGTRHVIIKASSDVASPSFWENFKPPKSSSTHSFSDILWPSAGMLLCYYNSFLYFYCSFGFCLALLCTVTNSINIRKFQVLPP
jgi:hypothetical protein